MSKQASSLDNIVKVLNVSMLLKRDYYNAECFTRNPRFTWGVLAFFFRHASYDCAADHFSGGKCFPHEETQADWAWQKKDRDNYSQTCACKLLCETIYSERSVKKTLQVVISLVRRSCFTFTILSLRLRYNTTTYKPSMQRKVWLAIM